MYKARLKRWGLHKYITKAVINEVAAANNTTITATAAHAPASVVGRRFTPSQSPPAALPTSEEGTDPCTGPKADDEAVATAAFAAWSPAPSDAPTGDGSEAGGSTVLVKLPKHRARARIHARLAPPDIFRLPEECIQLTQGLAFGLTDAGRWTTGGADMGASGSPVSYQWAGRVMLAEQFLDLAKFKRAFNILNASFDQFADLLDSPDPGLLQATYLIALQLNDEIGQRFLTFAAQMAAIKLPPSHPFRLILTRLQSAGFPQLQRHAHSILEAHLAALERALGVMNPGVLLLFEFLYDTLDHLSIDGHRHFIDPGLIESKQIGQIQRLSDLGQAAHAQSAKLTLAYSYHRRQQPGNALVLTQEVLSWLKAHPREQHTKRLDLWDTLGLRLFCLIELDRLDEVMAAGVEYISVMHDESPGSNRIPHGIIRIRKYFAQRGHQKGLDDLDAFIEATPGLEKEA